MRRSKIALILSAFMMLAITLAAPASAYANEKDTQTLVIVITKTTDAYGDNGKLVGVLNPGTDGEATYTPTAGVETTGVQVLYTYVGDSVIKQDGKLAGKTRVALRWESDSVRMPTDPPFSEMPATDDAAVMTTDDAAFTTTPIAEGAEPTATAKLVTPTPLPPSIVEPEIPDHVWIDTEIIIAELMQFRAADKAAMLQRDTQIEQLNEELRSNLYSSVQQAVDLSDTDDAEIIAQPAVRQANLSTLIFFGALGVLAVVGIGLIVHSLNRIVKRADLVRTIMDSAVEKLGRLAGRADDDVKLKNGFTSFLQDLLKQNRGFYEQAGANLDAIKNNTEKNAANTEKLIERTDKKRIEAGGTGLEVNQSATDPALLNLVNNRLAGIESQEEWSSRVRRAGYYHLLLTANPEEEGTYKEDSLGVSILACLMKDENAQEGYLVPSYKDAYAEKPRWKDFYTLVKDYSVTYYRIDRLAVVNITTGRLYKPVQKGVLCVGRNRSED